VEPQKEEAAAEENEPSATNGWISSNEYWK
jgi:hypothetical protein